jgi:hypothetical protein
MPWHVLIKEQIACAFFGFDNCLLFAVTAPGAAYVPGCECGKIYQLSFIAGDQGSDFYLLQQYRNFSGRTYCNPPERNRNIYFSLAKMG